MNEIKQVIDSLSALLYDVPVKFRQLPANVVNFKSNPEKWSKKEILGHLCDSCFNNIHRIIRVQYEDKPFMVYDQDEWVKNQDYQNRSIEEVLDLWVSLHKQFIHVLSNFPEKHLNSTLDWGGEVTAQFVITDYLDHHQHHLKQVFSK